MSESGISNLMHCGMLNNNHILFQITIMNTMIRHALDAELMRFMRIEKLTRILLIILKNFCFQISWTQGSRVCILSSSFVDLLQSSAVKGSGEEFDLSSLGGRSGGK